MSFKFLPDQKAVIGLGFGDEGKGHVVDWLCSKETDAAVVRFSGGFQAAHHVVLKDGREHVFAHFGSGTLRGFPTYWTGIAVMNPIALLNELDVLLDTMSETSFNPLIYIEDLALVTTPLDIRANQANRETRIHGTCGVGIFETIKRTKLGFDIRFRDLFYPSILERKYNLLRRHYGYYETVQEETENFFEACDRVTSDLNGYVELYDEPIPLNTDAIIFEGSQGLMLDQEFGFFPHVTPANTGTHHIIKQGFAPEVFLVTRAYQTRHGAGPMAPDVSNSIPNNPFERNGVDGFQGPFFKTLLDLEFLRYAVAKDDYIRRTKKNLVVTCLDLVRDVLRLQDGGRIIECCDEREFLEHIQEAVGAEKLFASYGPTAEDIEEIK